MLVPGIAALVAVIDQSTKQWIRSAFGLHDGVTVVGGFFDLKATGYRDPLLVAANDGVGTKLKLAIALGRAMGLRPGSGPAEAVRLP